MVPPSRSFPCRRNLFACHDFCEIKKTWNRRKLYALAVLEGHSRMLYVFFSHSQQQEYLHQDLLEACTYFDGLPKEVLVDNMFTAVTERVGSIIRFNEAFFDFLGKFSITPRACTVRMPQEKGKVENAIKYIWQNFRPLRQFADLADVQQQDSKSPLSAAGRL